MPFFLTYYLFWHYVKNPSLLPCAESLLGLRDSWASFRLSIRSSWFESPFLHRQGSSLDSLRTFFQSILWPLPTLISLNTCWYRMLYWFSIQKSSLSFNRSNYLKIHLENNRTLPHFSFLIVKLVDCSFQSNRAIEKPHRKPAASDSRILSWSLCFLRTGFRTRASCRYMLSPYPEGTTHPGSRRICLLKLFIEDRRGLSRAISGSDGILWGNVLPFVRT